MSTTISQYNWLVVFSWESTVIVTDSQDPISYAILLAGFFSREDADLFAATKQRILDGPELEQGD